MRFGEFTLDLVDRRLLRGGEAIELGSRYFDALALLANHSGQLVSKDQFMEEVWRGIPVTDEALTQAIRTLRRALGDEASAPRYIETVPKHGYRFVAEINHAGPPAAARIPQSPAARIAGATTLGGLAAGVIGGVFYGAIGTSGGIAGFITLLLLTSALALLGGAGIGTGMALASLWRGERDWAVVAGAVAGGVVVGTLGSALASYGLQALTGTELGRVTGTFEGMMLGLSAGLATLLAWRLALSRPVAMLVACACGASLTALTAEAGGRFYGTTLALLEGQFPHSDLSVTNIGGAFDNTGHAVIEGIVFTTCIVFANIVARDRHT